MSCPYGLNFRQDGSHNIREGASEGQVLVRVEVNAVDAAAGCDACGVKEMAAQVRRDGAIRVGKAGAPLFGRGKFCGDGAPRRLYRRRANHEDRWNWHARLDRR